MLRQILALLLLSSTLNCLEEEDDQPLLQRLEEFRRDHIVPVNETYGPDRMALVANHTSAVLEFFGWLGHLFVNGTLGYVNEYCTRPGPEWCADYIFVGANGSYELKQGVLSLFSDLYGIAKNRDLPSYWLFYPYPEGRNLTHDEVVFEEKTKYTFKDMFSSTYFYRKFDESHLGHAINMTPTENDTEGNRVLLKHWCTQLKLAEIDFDFLTDVSDNPILGLVYLVGPECEKVKDWRDRDFYDSKLELLKEDCYKFANDSGCFHNFLVRYMDYNRHAYESFVDELSKRLSEAVSYYGFCLPIALADPKEKRQISEWIADGIRVIAQQFHDALKIFNETRPTTTTSTTASSTSGSTANSAVSSSSVVANTLLTRTSQPSAVSSMSIIPKAELVSVVNSVLGVNGVKGQKPWRDRVSEHQTIANETFRNLTSKYASGDNHSISFQVLVYLPYPEGTSDQHCLTSDKNEYFLEGNQENGVDYFIHYYRNSSVLNTCLDRLWRRIQGKGPEILDAVFSPDTKDLCEEASKKVGASTHADCKFSGVAAVRCGYEFVWYELAYRYFTAGRTAGASFELSTGDTAYERNCGQIFLFP